MNENEYELNYPSTDGPISDRSVSYHKNPDLFKILTYWGYSQKSGQYYAIESTWRFKQVEENTHLYLDEVSLKYPNVSWFNDTNTPKVHLSDMHLRMAREQYRIRTGKQRCDFLILDPPVQEEA